MSSASTPLGADGLPAINAGVAKGACLGSGMKPLSIVGSAIKATRKSNR
jgi:hypothetical protein